MVPKTVNKLVATTSKDLTVFALAIEGPMKWSESYEIQGINQGSYTLMGDDGPLRDYSDCWYFANCLICKNHETKMVGEQTVAIFLHFYHCAQHHDYIFPQNEETIQTNDPELQKVISIADEYGLPMPEYDDHSNCIKQYRNNRPVCVVHSGNEHRTLR